MELMQASRQWASRPDDERFLNLFELGAKVTHQKAMSRAPIVSSREIEVQPHHADQKRGIQIVGKAGVPYTPTNWSFGQLATLAGAPAGYLRKLPAPVVADCMNYGLKVDRSIEDIGLLLTKENELSSLRAATGPRYGRIWNADIVNALIQHHGDGRTGRFRVPGEFGKEVPITKQNTTIYGSDRDMFVFLADEENRIDIPNDRNGQSGSVAKGFFVWNSEVGSATAGAKFFLFRDVCQNRIVWGARDVQEIRLRHTAAAPDRWIEEIEPVLLSYADAATASVKETIVNAQQKKFDDDLDDFLAKRFAMSGVQIKGIKAAHELEEGRPIETLWDAVNGVTAFAKTIPHQDDRVAMETFGGRLLDLAA
jgi:hypothetical protein